MHSFVISSFEWILVKIHRASAEHNTQVWLCVPRWWNAIVLLKYLTPPTPFLDDATLDIKSSQNRLEAWKTEKNKEGDEQSMGNKASNTEIWYDIYDIL